MLDKDELQVAEQDVKILEEILGQKLSDEQKNDLADRKGEDDDSE